MPNRAQLVRMISQIVRISRTLDAETLLLPLSDEKLAALACAEARRLLEKGDHYWEDFLSILARKIKNAQNEVHRKRRQAAQARGFLVENNRVAIAKQRADENEKRRRQRKRKRELKGGAAGRAGGAGGADDDGVGVDGDGDDDGILDESDDAISRAADLLADVQIVAVPYSAAVKSCLSIAAVLMGKVMWARPSEQPICEPDEGSAPKGRGRKKGRGGRGADGGGGGSGASGREPLLPLDGCCWSGGSVLKGHLEPSKVDLPANTLPVVQCLLRELFGSAFAAVALTKLSGLMRIGPKCVF